MNKTDYISACESQLKDITFYKKLKEDKNDTLKFTISEKIDRLFTEKLIDKKELKFLTEHLSSPRTPIFYGSPKIHKFFDLIPPMRPIVSGFNSCTSNLSEFIDSFLCYQARLCKSYVRDTKDFLCKINKIKELPPNSILVTMDVNSLYTNIDHEEGAQACFEKLEQRKNKMFPSIVIKELILIVLKSNVFRFCNSFYQQIKGTAMGTHHSPNYSNISMDKFERKLLSEYQRKTGLSPIIWLRFIDDIFFIWTSDENSLNDFIRFAQEFSQKSDMKSRIKFEVNISQNSVNFLDVKVILDTDKLKTTLFTKPTDSHLYLNNSSCHPSHVIKNIPKGQFLRLRRITMFQKE